MASNASARQLTADDLPPVLLGAIDRTVFANLVHVLFSLRQDEKVVDGGTYACLVVPKASGSFTLPASGVSVVDPQVKEWSYHLVPSQHAILPSQESLGTHR
jgi:hypothetical protein